MEWAIEGNEVYIVQARAVTTFKKPEAKKEVPAESGLKEVEADVLVKGETASPGVASGNVKIIKDISELNKIEKGDIMVTTMTTPICLAAGPMKGIT